MRFFEKVPVRVASMVQNSFEFFVIEIKPLFSIILTHLGPFGVTLPHTHPFNAITLLLYGKFADEQGIFSAPALKFTGKDWHTVGTGKDGAWFLTFRGPWSNTWQECRDGKIVTLTHGRKEI